MPDWKTAFDAEIDRARAMRQKGNEGQARVCARRAAGLSIKEYMHRNALPIRSASAYDLLKFVTEDARFSEEIRARASLLILRVDETFTLPAGVDLVTEAEQLAYALLGAPPDLAAA